MTQQTQQPNTPDDLAYLQQGFTWHHRQPIPGGHTLGNGLDWPTIDERLDRARAAGIDFQNREILESAPAEGHVTVGLFLLGAKTVTAYDARITACINTLARCLCWQFAPQVFHLPAERIEDLPARARKAGRYELAIDFGLLYHLERPANHLHRLAMLAHEALLDTHTAHPDATLETLDGLAGHWITHNPTNPLDGAAPRAFWLTKPALEQAAAAAGWTIRTLHEQPDHPNGPRGLYHLTRTP
jgi:hypothetical protein